MAKKQYTISQDMTLEEARAYRASLYNPEQEAALNDKQKREAFRIFWAQQKKNYPASKGINASDMENVLWLHLKAIKLDEPKDFSKGLQNFGLKRLGN